MRVGRRLVLMLSAVGVLEVGAAVSPPTTVDSIPGFSLLGRTLGELSPEICWRWPAGADRAVLRVEGLRGVALERVFEDRAIDRFAWTDYVVPESLEAEDVFGFTLAFFAGETELVAARVTAQNFAAVAGRGRERALFVQPRASFSGTRRRCREPAAVGLAPERGELSVDGVVRSIPSPLGWFGFPVVCGQTYALSFAPEAGATCTTLSVRGTGRALTLFIR